MVRGKRGTTGTVTGSVIPESSQADLGPERVIREECSDGGILEIPGRGPGGFALEAGSIRKIFSARMSSGRKKIPARPEFNGPGNFLPVTFWADKISGSSGSVGKNFAAIASGARNIFRQLGINSLGPGSLRLADPEPDLVPRPSSGAGVEGTEEGVFIFCFLQQTTFYSNTSFSFIWTS